MRSLLLTVVQITASLKAMQLQSKAEHGFGFSTPSLKENWVTGVPDLLLFESLF